MANRRNKAMLVILDGWGLAPDGPGNAVNLAQTPNWDRLWAALPHGQLTCHGPAVGLPDGVMGNSEVGHLNLGAGRVVYQDIIRIDRAVATGDFFKNPALTKLCAEIKRTNGRLHLLGLVSDGGVHSALRHLNALLDLARNQGLEAVVHAFMDGRDSPPHSGKDYMAQLLRTMADKGVGRVGTIGGRYWGMDRDKRWDRVEKHYAALVRGEGQPFTDPAELIARAYEAGETDEFITPSVLVDQAGHPACPIASGDGIVFFNFRADRAREMTAAFTQPEFDGFDAADRPALAGYVTMTQYDAAFDLPTAFGPEQLTGILGQVVSEAGLSQLRAAETEKYAHVTYFFSGGREEPFPGEDRLLIPSPRDVQTYDQKPAMSAVELTEAVLAKIGQYDLIVMNYANGDMVGHTGILPAAIEACQAVDHCLGRIEQAALAAGYDLVVTADHGNAEEMIGPDGQPWTAHSITDPVPFILASRPKATLRPSGVLGDVAPTMVQLMKLTQPEEMTGRSMIETTGD